MRHGVARSGLVAGLLGALGAIAQAQTLPMPAKHRHETAGHAGRSLTPSTPANRRLLDDLVKGSPDQQAAERQDNELAGMKPPDHRKDDFFSDWRGLK